MEKNSLKQKTAKGIFWGGLSNILQQLIGMLIGIQMARMVCVDDYGLIGMLAAFSAIASTIINSGFTTALVNKSDAIHEDYNAVFWFTVIVSLLCYFILFFSAPLIADFFDQPVLIPLSRVLFICFVLGGVSSVSYAVLLKQMKIKQIAVTDIVATLLSGVVGILMAKFDYGYWALAAQNITFIAVGGLMRFFIAPWKPTISFNLKPLKAFFSFSIKLFFTNIINQLSSNLYSFVFGKFYGPTTVGFYNQGSKWMFMGHSFINGMLSSVAQPALVNCSDSLERQKHIFHKLLRFGAFVSFPIMLGLAFVAKEFIVLALGIKWLDSVIFLQMFCMWGAFGFVNIMYTMLLVSHNKSNVYMMVSLFVSALQFFTAFLLYRFGILIMVCGYICSFFAGFFVWQHYARKYVGIRFLNILQDILPYLSIALIAFLIAFAASYKMDNLIWILITKILVTAFVYVGILWISGSVLLKESIDFFLHKKIA